MICNIIDECHIEQMSKKHFINVSSAQSKNNFQLSIPLMMMMIQITMKI